jgi:hypothetical protein
MIGGLVTTLEALVERARLPRTTVEVEGMIPPMTLVWAVGTAFRTLLARIDGMITFVLDFEIVGVITLLCLLMLKARADGILRDDMDLLLIFRV